MMGLQSVLILSITCAVFIPHGSADPGCDFGMCQTACQSVDLIGTCDSAGDCQCTFHNKCKDMELECDLACKAFSMDGECDDQDNCVCKASPEVCWPTECTEQCDDDPRAKECILVEPTWCLKYGPFQFCGCLCIQARRRRLNLLRQKKIFHRYAYNVSKSLNDI